MVGCSTGSTEPTVRVDLKTDYVPFVEFDAVRVQVDDGDVALRFDHVVERGEDYLRGQRINEAMTQAGEHALTVTLFRGGNPVATRRVSAIVQPPITVVTIVLTRNCEGVMCPNDNPALDSCLGGRCVDPRCTPQTPEFCPPDQCMAASECAVPDVACVEGRCDDGVCLAVPNDALCEAGEVCHGVRGCIELEADAGVMDAAVRDAGVMDAGVMDAAAPDVFDAAAPDVFDAAAPDVFDAGPPEITACDAPDDDTLFLFAFDDDTDAVTGQSGFADNSLLQPSDSPCGGNALRITNDSSPSSHFRVPDRAAFQLAAGSIDFYVRGPLYATTHDIIGRDAQDNGAGHFTLSTSEENEIVLRSQSETEEFYICSEPTEFEFTWRRIGINFGTGGVELWIDGVRQRRGGMVMYRASERMCESGIHELDLVGNDNPFVAGAVAIFSDDGSHLPLSRPFVGLEIDQLRLSSVRRDYENEVRP